MNETERQIVAWLRKPERRKLVNEGPHTTAFWGRDALGEEIGWEETNELRRLPTAHDFADAIERGEHRESDDA